MRLSDGNGCFGRRGVEAVAALYPMSSTSLMRSGIVLPTVESSSPQARIWLHKSCAALTAGSTGMVDLPTKDFA